MNDDKKPTNPKDAVGIAKVPHSTLSAQVMGEVGLAMMEGALKYGRSNYREAGVRASVYYDALMRHIDAFWEGQDIDARSGLSHVTKAIACLMVLRDSMLQENWVDDRPPKAKNQNWVEDLNAKAKALLEMYPNPVPACTEKDEVDQTFYVQPPAPSFCPWPQGSCICPVPAERITLIPLVQQPAMKKVEAGVPDSTGSPGPSYYYTTFSDD